MSCLRLRQVTFSLIAVLGLSRRCTGPARMRYHSWGRMAESIAGGYTNDACIFANWATKNRIAITSQRPLRVPH